jgi:hypothetical protein
MVLAGLLGGKAVTAPWIPPWVIFLPFMMIPVFLVLIGRAIERAPVDGRTRAAVARQVT